MPIFQSNYLLHFVINGSMSHWLMTVSLVARVTLIKYFVLEIHLPAMPSSRVSSVLSLYLYVYTFLRLLTLMVLQTLNLGVGDGTIDITIFFDIDHNFMCAL